MPPMNRSAHRAAVLLLAAAAFVLPGLPARADFDWDIRAGIYTEDTDPFVGVGGLWDLGNTAHWYFNPNIEAIFIDDGSAFTLNGDFHYDLELDTPFFVWVGAGPALLHVNPDEGDGESDLGANVFVGIGAKRQDLRPWAQVKILLVEDDSQAVAQVGLRF